MGRRRIQFFTVDRLVNNRPIKFKFDNGPQVSLIPKQFFNNKTLHVSDNKRPRHYAFDGGEFTGYCKILKGLYGLADLLTIFQEKLEKTLAKNYGLGYT